MNGKPTAAQKRWHEWVLSHGCIVTGHIPELHHIKGARMRLKGVNGYAGEWYVIPLCEGLHRTGKIAVHKNRREFEKAYMSEKELFVILSDKYKAEFGRYPDESWQIIIDRA